MEALDESKRNLEESQKLEKFLDDLIDTSIEKFMEKNPLIIPGESSQMISRTISRIIYGNYLEFNPIQFVNEFLEKFSLELLQ